ncbi:bifunctional nuclease family protein [Sulfuracidifex tepidarius]|nr:bifunctional nuclease domain-containing protein [Sulfuracidifex tepidarius]
MNNNENLSKVINIDAFFIPIYNSPAIICYLEDNRQFMLSNVTPEIVFAIRKLNNKDGVLDDRENIFDILNFVPELRQDLENHINRVIINDLNDKIGVYSATIEINFGNSILIEKRMIPSHAIYLGLLTKKPIYVKKELVDEQERENRNGEE